MLPFRLALILLTAGLVLQQSLSAFAAPPLPQCKVAFERQLKSKGIKVFRMRLKPGESCRYAIPYKRGITIDRIRLIERPRAGRVSQLRRNSFVYRAPKSGKDVFAIGYTGRTHTYSGAGALAFVIEVR